MKIKATVSELTHLLLFNEGRDKLIKNKEKIANAMKKGNWRFVTCG